MGVLVDREREQALIDGAVKEVRQSGQGRLVLVFGEAGAGKTALARDVLARLPTGTRGLLGSCDSLRTARPYGPVLDWGAVDGSRLVAAIG